MADANEIGRMHITIDGKDIGASKAIDKVEKKAAKATGSMQKLGDASSKVSSAVGQILMPVALISSITGAITLLVSLKEKANAAKTALDEAGESAVDLLRQVRSEGRELTAQQKELIALGEQIKTQTEAANAAAEKGAGIWTGMLRNVAQFSPTFNQWVKSTDQLVEGFEKASNSAAEINAATMRTKEATQDAAEIQSTADADAKFRADFTSRIIAEQNKLRDEERAKDKKHQEEKAKAAKELHEMQMAQIEELDQKLQDSIAGGLFGSGAVAGGQLGQMVSELAVIAERLGGK